MATGGAGGGAAEVRPSAALEEMCAAGGLDARECRQLALAIGSLLRKGYFSTVGAVKVEGELVLKGGTGAVAERRCSLVDFAGQMEYLVSHQLLLASMHTLCVVIQPEGSHADATSKHHGSWRVCAVCSSPCWATGAPSRWSSHRRSSIASPPPPPPPPRRAPPPSLLPCGRSSAKGSARRPTRLDYRPDAIAASLGAVVARLSAAADAVSSDWWVPASYEHLAAVVGSVKEAKARARALPILSRAELVAAIEADGHEGLRRMCVDPLMLQRGIDYLEAVGDVMSDGRLDVLLLDPVGWFAGFLAHFIRDDGKAPAEVVRGVVSLADVVAALRHEYLAPETQVPEVMALVCNLELCVELSTLERDAAGAGRYLFPCLLPAATPHEIALHWPRAAPGGATAELIVRGHRFRAAGAFLPPGVFPSLVARLARLPQGWVHSSRLWKDAAVLHFREAAALLRVDLTEATIDISVAAPADACHFVGAAKGQASAVRWLAHLVRQMLARSYAQIEFDELALAVAGLPRAGAGRRRRRRRRRRVRRVPRARVRAAADAGKGGARLRAGGLLELFGHRPQARAARARRGGGGGGGGRRRPLPAARRRRLRLGEQGGRRADARGDERREAEDGVWV